MNPWRKGLPSNHHGSLTCTPLLGEDDFPCSLRSLLESFLPSACPVPSERGSEVASPPRPGSTVGPASQEHTHPLCKVTTLRSWCLSTGSQPGSPCLRTDSASQHQSGSPVGGSWGLTGNRTVKPPGHFSWPSWASSCWLRARCLAFLPHPQLPTPSPETKDNALLILKGPKKTDRSRYGGVQGSGLYQLLSPCKAPL